MQSVWPLLNEQKRGRKTQVYRLDVGKITKNLIPK